MISALGIRIRAGLRKVQDGPAAQGAAAMEAAGHELRHKAHGVVGLGVAVRVVPPKTVERSIGKAKLVLDERPKGWHAARSKPRGRTPAGPSWNRGRRLTSRPRPSGLLGGASFPPSRHSRPILLWVSHLGSPLRV